MPSQLTTLVQVCWTPFICPYNSFTCSLRPLICPHRTMCVLQPVSICPRRCSLCYHSQFTHPYCDTTLNVCLIIHPRTFITPQVAYMLSHPFSMSPQSMNKSSYLLKISLRCFWIVEKINEKRVYCSQLFWSDLMNIISCILLPRTLDYYGTGCQSVTLRAD